MGGVVGLVEFLFELVLEERLDSLQDVRYRRVVLAQVGTLTRGHHCLEHGAEDVWVDVQPDLSAQTNGHLTCLGREARDCPMGVRAEKAAVDVGKVGQVAGLFLRVGFIQSGKRSRMKSAVSEPSSSV